MNIIRVSRSICLALTFAMILLPGVAQADGVEPFEPIDAQKLIDDCWAISREQRDSGVNEQIRKGKIEAVKCLKKAILNQETALTERLIPLEIKNGEDPEEIRQIWEEHLSTIAKEGSCYPSCSPIEESNSLDSDARIGEAMIRDFVAERNLYKFPPKGSAGGDPGGVFSEIADADKLIEGCWGISKELRSTGVTGLHRIGTGRTTQCLWRVIMDQVEALFEENTLSRRKMREYLDHLSTGSQKIYWVLYNEHRGCDPFCGTIFQTFHLSAYASILEKIIRDMISQRVEYNL